METKERESLLQALLDGRLPDKNGRFGPFGGRYVPETLMPAIERLTHGVEHILPSADFQAALGARAEKLDRPADRIDAGADVEPTLGRGRLAEARGFGAHGRAQDQQRYRPSVAREGARRKARRRRNRRGPARRRVGRGLRARRPAVHRVHGRDRRRAPSAERRSYAPLRRDRRRREIRRPHAARGDRRGDSRLGVGPRRHVLPARLGDRAAPVSLPRAAAASRDRPRGARANAERGGRTARRGIRLRRRRLERDRPISRLSRRSQRQDLRRRGRRPRRGARRPLGDVVVRQTRRAARHAHDAALRQARPDPGDALDLGRSRLPRRRSRACVAASDRPRRIRHGQRRRDARVARRAVRHRGHPARARELARARGREALGREEPGCTRADRAFGPRRQGHADSRQVPRGGRGQGCPR